jgi:Xaa-Pro dipeptidase
VIDSFSLHEAQGFLRQQRIDGWLLVDFQQNNPVFWQVIGRRRHTTRRAFLLIPPDGPPRFLLHMVDAERLADLGWPIEIYQNRAEQEAGLARLLEGRQRIAMEYSPMCALPVVSRVDAGTVEEIRALGIEVVSSGDVLQYAVARWSAEQVEAHRYAAAGVVQIVREAFDFIGANLHRQPSEFEICQFMRDRMAVMGLMTEEGPAVAVDAHSGDPHYEPSAEHSSPIAPGSWILIDIWAKRNQPRAIYGDTTWVAYAGETIPPAIQRAFDSVRRARDAALKLLEDAWRHGRALEGWEVDEVARAIIRADGYGQAFTHRLGHSLGETVHGTGVNLDGFETRDTRKIIPGLGFTVEPGVYLPTFGVRLEVNVYVDPDRGPVVTTPLQESIVTIGS